MQQYYHIDLAALDLGRDGADASRAAALCAQLPRGARCRAAEFPDEGWGVAEQLLRQMEYDLRAIHYALVAKKGDPAPEPIPMPSEERSAGTAQEDVEATMAEVAALIGIGPTDDGEEESDG